NAWAPDDPDVSPGGSSSGSATAVAARLAASSTGTQTGGSITVPSNAQGLTGLKPTMGRVSLRGVIPLTYTRDHPGPLARDARDAALMLNAMAGPDPADPRTLGLPPVPDLAAAAEPVERAGRVTLRWPTRIGVMPDYADGEDAEGPARANMLATFERLGATLIEVDPPRDWETLTGRQFNNVRLPERTEPFLEHLRADVRRFGVSLSPWINGVLMDADVYLKGQRAKLLLLRRVLEELFAECDVVFQSSHLPFDMIGLPLIAFPIGFDDAAAQPRPIGALLGGLPFGEDRLLSLVAAYQAVTDWHRRRPPEPSGKERDEAPARRVGRVQAQDVMDLAQ
ncbi:MAG: amidase family protein, partial [Longimicrobiales bacterium]